MPITGRRYLLFTAQKPDGAKTRMFGIPAYGALPGWGTQHDTCTATAEGSAPWRLTNDAYTERADELQPVISADGQKVAWGVSERFAGHVPLVTDWWAMRLDGSGAKRPNFMNSKKSNNLKNQSLPMAATTAAVSPTGTTFEAICSVNLSSRQACYPW